MLFHCYSLLFQVLLDAVDGLSAPRLCQLSEAMTLLECVACVREVMNSKVGLSFIISNTGYIRQLTKGKTRVSE